MPPLRMTGSWPSARSALAIVSRWPVQLVRTRQFRSWWMAVSDVGDYLLVALVAGDEVLVDEGHPAGCGRAGASGVAVGGRVDVQHRRGASAWCAAGQHVRSSGGLPGDGDGVADRADLHADQVVELVAAVGGGGQPEPSPGSDLAGRVLERGGRDVVALISDDQPVPGRQFGDVVAAGQGLQGDDVDGAAQLGAAAAELAGFDAEELSDPGPPLVGQGLAVDQDEGGDLVGGNDRAGHHGLPGSGRRNQHPEVVPGEFRDRVPLGRRPRRRSR